MSETTSPADVWAQITAMPRAHRKVPFPRSKPCVVCPDGGSNGGCDHPREPLCELEIVVLNQGEVQQSVAMAEARTRKVLGAQKRDEAPSRGYEDLRNLYSSIELLFRACRKVDDIAKPFFAVKEHIEVHLTPDEIGVLVNMCCHVQAELGPIVSSLTPGEANAWIDRLAEGGSAFPLDSLSWGALMTLVATLARRCATSRTAISSPGLLPDESTSEPPSESESSEAVSSS